jgi:hypothetical protein
MRQCEFCRAPLPEDASYCGVCLHVPWPKTITDHPQQGNNPGATGIQNTAVSTARGEEDEERKRRAALIGSAVPIFGVWGQPQGTVPMVQGTPQMPGVPTVAGTPSIPGMQPPMPPQVPGLPSTGAPPMPGMHPPSFPQAYGSTFPGTHTLPGQPTHPLHPPHHQHHPSHQPHPSHSPHAPHGSHHPRAHHRPRGCTPRLIILAITITILIIASFISLGLTVWQPGLSLSGSSSVVSGGTLVVHGRSFMPGSSITLTLDGGIPVYFARSVPRQMARNANATGAIADVSVLALASSANNNVSAGMDGSFTVTILVDSTWQPGKHTIHAIESLSHRSASLDFSILQNGTTTPGTTPSPQSGTATATATSSPSPTKTATPTTSPTPTKTGTATPASLSCLNPGTLNLGPVMQASTQPVSAQVTLCTTGTGTINWSATVNAAPWLKLDHTGGRIVAPGKTQVTISASAASLTPGNYTTTITFNGQPGNSIEHLNVSFVVSIAPPCVTASPSSLNFSGVAGLSDPPGSQTITVTNCGAIPGTWSASIVVGSGGNWLTINPTTSTLAVGASTPMTVTASNLNAGLGAGTYNDTVTISIGTSTVSIPVTLTVQAAPQISVTPTSIFADQDPQCKLSNQWTCFVTLTNSSSTVALNWTGSSSGLSGVTITPGPSGFTIPPGQTEQVQITLPNFCENTVTLTFQGPVNAATVSWTCAA